MLRSQFILPAIALTFASGVLAQSVGLPFCSPSNNSTGSPTSLAGTTRHGIGSHLHLEVTGGVPGEIGYFLAGNEKTAGVAVGNGMLCLVGTGTSALYRYNAAGSSSSSFGLFDSAGVLQNLVGTSTSGTGFDVPDTIPGSAPIAIMSGDTWHFQFWHRDTPAAQGTSNLSNGLSITFPLATGAAPIPDMVQIPAGSFSMGSNAPSTAPYYNDSNQQPVHQVTISETFWMSATEVTQAEFQALMGVNPSYFSGPNMPVEKITWTTARAYTTALTAQEQAAGRLPTGKEYRLPTEAEWEYACRAGTTTEFNLGTELPCEDAQIGYSFYSNSSCGLPSPAEVGSFEPNAFGLYDMHGNVWEWCLDSFADYTSASQTDPFVTIGTLRTVRSGCWFGNSSVTRSAYRGGRDPNTIGGSIGIRVVLGSILAP